MKEVTVRLSGELSPDNFSCYCTGIYLSPLNNCFNARRFDDEAGRKDCKMKWMRFRVRTKTDAEDILISFMEDIGLYGAQIEDNVPLTASEKEQKTTPASASVFSTSRSPLVLTA